MRSQFRTPAARLGSVALRQGGRRTSSHRWMGNGSTLSSNAGAEPVVGGQNYETVCAARRDEALARLEAVLFLAREPLPSRKLAQLAHLADGTAARTLIRRLSALYDRTGCAFRLEEVAGGFQLLTRPMFGPWLRRLLPMPVETRLSSPSLETLAVVAYRQPVARADIESIRGVQCGEILRQLMQRDLVRIAGRSDDLGRPFLYGTTKRFLQIFGLRHLDELPRAALLCSRSTADSPTAAPQPMALPIDSAGFAS